eukprot:750757-Alexandrium_andersonii.AAC.1
MTRTRFAKNAASADAATASGHDHLPSAATGTAAATHGPVRSTWGTDAALEPTVAATAGPSPC